MEILLLRHGKTRGNLERRYVGCTDEPLLPDAAADLEQSGYRNFCPDLVYISPMLRCRETAEILFPECICKARPQFVQTIEPLEAFSSDQIFPAGTDDGSCMLICSGLRETDFGAFEYKTYDELKDDSVYQAWIDSGGMIASPGGESGTDFRMRCRKAFLTCLRHAKTHGARKVAFVTHGGVIMSIMEAYARPHADFYHWQLQNGCGYFLYTASSENDIFVRLL